MPLVVACYVVANEASSAEARSLLSESIRSIKAYVDKVIVIDSVFTTNPHPGTCSSDGTRQLIEALLAAEPPVAYDYVASPTRLTEPEARNAYLERVAPGCWVFVIDGDEVLYGDWSQTQALVGVLRSGRSMFDSYLVPVYTVAVNSPRMAPQLDLTTFADAPLISTRGVMPRLFKSQKDLRYTVPPGAVTPALTYLKTGSYIISTEEVFPGSMFLINHHTRQSYESYQNDYIWETSSVQPA